tara:strand:+ start:278 stop:862 length:585 start_codon:yes stop_codon:yes gene_type:complete
MKKSTRLEIYRVIGMKDEHEIVMIDGFFDHGDGFQGVTGSSFDFYCPDQIAEMNDIDEVTSNYDYLWAESVADGNTTESLEDYMQGFIDSYLMNSDSMFIGHDTSYIFKLQDDKALMIKYDLKDVWDDEKGTFGCIGGGRMFSKDEKELDNYFDDPIRQALHVLAKEFEAKKIDIKTVEKFLIDNNIDFKKEGV